MISQLGYSCDDADRGRAITNREIINAVSSSNRFF